MQMPVNNILKEDRGSELDMDCESSSSEQPIVQPDFHSMADCYIYSELKKDATVTQVTIDKVTGCINSLLAGIFDIIRAHVAKLSARYNIPDTDDLMVAHRNSIQVNRNPFQGFRRG